MGWRWRWHWSCWSRSGNGLSRYIWGDHKEAQVTLDLHEDGLILCENGVSLSNDNLSASHPVCEGCMGSCK